MLSPNSLNATSPEAPLNLTLLRASTVPARAAEASEADGRLTFSASMMALAAS